MATLVSRATGNFTSTTTWKTVETGTRAIQNTHSASTNTTTSYVYNADAQDFTIANLSVIEGILLFCDQVTTTGTVSVALSEDSGTTATREVTINATDLPSEPSWVFFKFGSTLTGDGGTDYAIGIKGSSAGNAAFYRDGTAANWSHIIVTDQNPGSIAAGDVFYIVGEQTGTGTENAFTVTMDSTATTDYGTGVAGVSDNGVDIGALGTLTWGTSAATNYYLKLSGSLAIWGDGTMNMGTTGTPCPRDSTMTLTFDCGANVDFGLTVNNGGTWNAQGLSRTSGKNIVSCKLNTDEAAGQTTLGVDTDTGWLNGDEIAIASTTRTASECESRTLNANANASDMTVSSGLTNAHSGTSPTQAEVILLTRNVKVFGASASLQTYVDINTTSTVDIDWVEFKWLGSNTVLKRGISMNTTTGNCNIQYSSLHNFEVANSIGIHTTNAAFSNFTFSNNVCYLIANIHLSITTTSGTWTADSNIFMRNTDNANIVNLSDIGGTFTNNTIVGATSSGVVLNEASGIVGTFSNITSHSNSSNGVSFSSGAVDSVFSNITSWRNTSVGLNIGGGLTAVTFDTITLFGNTTLNIQFFSSCEKVIFNNAVCNGDTTFSTTAGVGAGSASSYILSDIVFNNADFSTVSGIKTAHTRDITAIATVYHDFLFINSKLGAATEVLNQTNMTSPSRISSQKHDQTAGLHKTWKKYGTITIETTTTHSGGTSFKMTPNNASNKLESGSFKIPVANGASLTPSVYVYEDASYNGARARLILKRNDAIGITSDTVIDTATAASDAAWEQLTGTTATATDDGVMEFIIDCDGTAGNLFVDTFTVT